MTIARVSAHDGTGTTSATFGGTPTAGNLLLCAVATSDASPTCTITGWTLIATVGSASTFYLFLFAKTAAGTEGTVTPTSTAAVNLTSVCEYSGTANPYATDGTATSSTGTTPPLTTGSITTTNANDLIFTVCYVLALGSVTAPSWTTATEILSNNGATFALFCGQNIVSTTESGYTDVAHWTATTSLASATLIAAFKATAAAQIGPFVGHIGHS